MTEPAADRRDRYAAALLGPDAAGSLDSAADELIDAVMAVADAELAAVLPPADRAALRDRIAAAIRDAACPGNCGKTEEECAKERIQPFVWHHGRLAVVEGAPEMFADAVLAVLPPPADRADAETLAAMFEGLGLLLATSSRDWGQYAPDAWLYAVVLGWDCEETEHDETCVHGAMEEMQQLHGWSDEAVAKARRYRAVVRALTESAAGVRRDGAQQ